ncbi:Kef-type K+ transport system membrane component KefB [Agromyces hippuratus]|uniref:Kef-type K+ transport system membrane component KefB n=1 Tax=Agromyces hippuratus TaxID=286438 RepID=A0A852WQH6_9MICO|nr:cation:proton antiporter [Agromyces hippuratus]NYG20259.1 Kef-type K+ transport system membrane component KefB [Agromyces hippuratus]
MEISIGTMVLVPAIAVAAPLLVRAIGKWVAIPLVVFEIVLGLLLGPAVLGWIVPDDFMTLLADFGLAMLFFLAGNEIDFRAIRGRPLSRAAIGWIISLAAGIGIATLLAADLPAAAFIGIALTSTALGTIMPVLRDSGDLGTPFGIAVIALGAVGEFGPLLAISIFLSGRSPLLATIVLLSFAVIAGIAIWLAAKGVGRRMHRVITATLHTSGQFAVRLVIFVLLALVALSIVLDLDMLLGAFTAGVLYRLLISGAPERDVEVVETKLEAVGYGFLVPVFFINTGVAFDLESLFADVRTTVLLPVFLVLLLVVRGLPSLLAAPAGSSRRDLVATALFGATGLPIIVAVTAIGVDNGDLPSGTAAALVGAGMLSVLLFPLIALAIRKGRSDAVTRTSEDDPLVPVEG